MEHYAVRGIPLQWFESFLSDRKQYVSVNGHTSDELQVIHGVPQDSALGPLLFSTFINDLPNVSKFLQFYLFADDTNSYYESSDLLDIQNILNRELRNVRKWLEANRLSSNFDETNFGLFHSSKRKLTQTIVLKIGRNKIKQETHVRIFCVCFIGFYTELEVPLNLTELSEKLARTVGLFYKIRHYAPLFVSCHFCTFSCIWCVCVRLYLSIFVKSNFCVIKENSIFDSLKVLKFKVDREDHF